MTPPAVLRVGLVADMLEEGWPSMDLVADMLVTHLDPARVSPTLLRPALTRRLSRLAGSNGQPRTSDRIINRFWDYPRWLRGRLDRADVFHVIDHSYAHLATELPKGRVVVTCHDTDAFRPLRNGAGRESRLPRYLVRRTLSGLQRADVVVCVSEATRRELVGWGLVPMERTEVVPNGVDDVFLAAPDPSADAAAAVLLPPGEYLDLLHVGSTIPRKRIDLLLHVIALVRQSVPRARLLRVGGPLTPAQDRLASDLGIAEHIVSLPFVDRRTLAAVYRRAIVTLLPSEREGFGLPLIESLASGTPVVATTLDVFREVGGDAAAYAPLEDIAAWRDAVVELLREREQQPQAWQARQGISERRGRSFSWALCASRMEAIYARTAERAAARGC